MPRRQAGSTSCARSAYRWIFPVAVFGSEVCGTIWRERMAAFKRPRQVVPQTSLPKTATGKIQRYALRAQLVDPA